MDTASHLTARCAPSARFLNPIISYRIQYNPIEFLFTNKARSSATSSIFMVMVYFIKIVWSTTLNYPQNITTGFRMYVWVQRSVAVSNRRKVADAKNITYALFRLLLKSTYVAFISHFFMLVEILLFF